MKSQTVSALERLQIDWSKEFFSEDLEHIYRDIFSVYYPDESLCAQAKEFSDRVDTRYQEERNRVSAQKTRVDHYRSKIAEWGVHKALKRVLPDLSFPSFEIHKREDKRWSSDLFDIENEVSISVKCCPLSNQAYYWEEEEPSFTFGYRLQKGDYDKKFFGKRVWSDRSWVCLCVVDDDVPATRIFFMNRILSMFDTWPYREPKLKKHRNTKRVIYGNDLLRLFRFRILRSISCQLAAIMGIELE